MLWETKDVVDERPRFARVNPHRTVRTLYQRPKLLFPDNVYGTGSETAGQCSEGKGTGLPVPHPVKNETPSGAAGRLFRAVAYFWSQDRPPAAKAALFAILGGTREPVSFRS